MSSQLLKNWLESYLPVLLQEAEEYFAKNKYRGEYYVEMKRQMVQEIKKFDPNITLHRLAKIFNCDHSTVHKMLNPDKDMLPEVVDLVRMNGKDWIKKGIYPMSKSTIRNGKRLKYLNLVKL